MKLRSIVIIVAVSVFALAGCGPKNKVKNENAAVEGRDRELYEQAKKKAEKGRYDEARLLYNVVITTYPDSPYQSLAKLSIADTFYLEGGTSNLQQAIGGYKDFAQFFPTHPQICAVKLRIAQAYMRQMGAYNRDVSNAKQAEHQLKSAEQTCRNSPLLPKIQTDLERVQQNLALHELDIARFYIDKRQAYKSGESRLRDIINNYPFFSYFDESLYRLGVSLIEQEQPEEAAEYFTRLVRDYSKSEYAGKGKEYLEKLNKPIPEPSNDNAAPDRPGLMGKVKLIMGNNGLDITEDGVLLSKKGQEKEDVKESVKASETPAQPGTRAVRASSKGQIQTDQTDANQTSAPSNGATNGASDNQTATPAPKSGDSKKEDKKDSKKKVKKSFLGGIFK